MHSTNALRRNNDESETKPKANRSWKWKHILKSIGMKAIDVGKTVAIDAGMKLVEKTAKKLSASKSQVANVMVPREKITKKVNEVIAKYVDTCATDRLIVRQSSN